jgi:hypothetical protein
MEGPIHHVSDADIHFLYDLTHTSEGKMVPEQIIFDRIYKAIEEADLPISVTAVLIIVLVYGAAVISKRKR